MARDKPLPYGARWLYIQGGHRYATRLEPLTVLIEEIAHYFVVDSFEDTHEREWVGVVDEAGTLLDDETLDALLDPAEERLRARLAEIDRQPRPAVPYYTWDGKQWEER